MMKQAYTTKEIRTFFQDLSDDEIMDYTCSMFCDHCGKRIWFHGDLDDHNSPANFECPYCTKVTTNKTKIHYLYKEKCGSL